MCIEIHFFSDRYKNVTETIGRDGFRHGSFFHSNLELSLSGINEGSNSDKRLFGSGFIVNLLNDDITPCMYSLFFCF